MNLKIARHISLQEWMKRAETHQVFSALQSANAPAPEVLFVGGCVRNALMGRDVEDVDLATVHDPQSVMEKLMAAKIGVVPTGLQHGTVMAVINGHAFEITTLRRDVETYGRHALVDYTNDWSEDAQRRDFTMNTLLMDLQGNIYDPTGQGLRDLDQCNIRFVGDAAKRIEEDYLRILRFFRFHAIYGKGEFDADALTACAGGASKIKNLSRERISQEFFKILSSDKAHEILSVMFAHNVLEALAFTPEEGEFFKHFCTFQSRYGLTALAPRLLVFAGLDMGKIKTMEQWMVFPKVFIKDMQAIKGALALRDLSCDSAMRESIYRFGRNMSAQALMIELVQDRVMNGYAPKALEIVQNWDIPTFPVNGRDLMALGIEKGPALGEKLEALENWWIDQDFTPDKTACLDHLKCALII